jgi:hypothetical protein
MPEQPPLLLPTRRQRPLQPLQRQRPIGPPRKDPTISGASNRAAGFADVGLPDPSRLTISLTDAFDLHRLP